MKYFAALAEEGANVSTGIHGSGENVLMVREWLRLSEQTPKDAGQGNGFL